MSALQDRVSGADNLTPDHPEIGEIGMGEVALSRVAYWREDGLHVFRSTEYDVIAADEDKQVAIIAFVEQSEDYALLLADGMEATMEDLNISNLIFRRLLIAYERAGDRHGRQLAVLRRLRGRRHNAGRGWHHEPAALT